MNWKLVEKGGLRYVELSQADAPLLCERDALDIVAACGECGTDRLMLRDAALPDAFFRLGTGLAGQVLQKLSNYRVKTALVVKDEKKMVGKFKELAAESRRSRDFRVFCDDGEAEEWLLGQ